MDINLFKASKEKAAEIAKSSSDIDTNITNNNSTSGNDGLADEDAHMMIKLKFLTYKVGM